MNHRYRNTGFALPAAIFVVVVLGAAVVAMGRLNSVQSNSLALAVQGSRAYWAAQAGVEWGVSRIENSAPGVACADISTPKTLSDLEGALGSFTVQVSCTRAAYKEGSATDNVFIYEIISEASYGSGPADPDYVYRRVQATVAVKS